MEAQRIVNAVRDLEARSAAELVVAVRTRSGSYAYADARAAAIVTLLSLVVLVFMPWTVPPVAVLLDAALVYLLTIAVAHRVPPLRRLLTTGRERAEAVRTHASALFHQRGIANTAGETGVLLYASLLERRIEVLADRGLLRAVPANDWNALTADLRDEQRVSEEAIVALIERLGRIVERALPVREGDVDELPSAPEIGV